MSRTTAALVSYAGVGYSRVSHGLADARCCRFTGPSAAGAPSAGGDVDGVTGVFTDNPGDVVFPAVPGHRVQIEAGAAFSSGAQLETLSDGRVQTVSTGKAVLRALETASGAGVVVWAVFTSGR